MVGVLQAILYVSEVAVDSAQSLTAAAPERRKVEVFVSTIATEAVNTGLESTVSDGSIICTRYYTCNGIRSC